MLYGEFLVSGARNVSAPLALTISGKATYSLTSDSAENASETLQRTIAYTVNSAKNDSSVEGKSMALVLTPDQNSDLPKDAVLQVAGDDADSTTTYKRNGNGDFIIPIGTITSGSKQLILTSEMFPDEAKDYAMTAQLYIAESLEAQSPMNGKKAGSSMAVTFKKAAITRPALRVTGTRIAAASEWGGNGQDISIEMQNIADGKLTVTAYSGLTGTQKVTDLLSSVSGIF